MRLVTAALAASIRGPGASVWFIDPDASSTTITGTEGVVLGAVPGSGAVAPAVPPVSSPMMATRTARTVQTPILAVRAGAATAEVHVRGRPSGGVMATPSL